MRPDSADNVRATIADYMLGESTDDLCLGDVRLHEHQRLGVARIRRLLDEHRGALLADDVGLGKTYVALALARETQNTLVIAPAALRDSWTASAAAAHVRITFVSVQSLARDTAVSGPFDLVIVDEAHHLRSSTTLRFASAVRLCRDSRVLLLTATPIQNRLADVRNVLSLFLGQRAFALPADALSLFVVRRLETDLASSASVAMPRVAAPISLPSLDDVDCLDRIAALPPPTPPAGGGDGGVLLTYSLVRQWGSSRGALMGALRRRLARARAMEDALSAGRLPTASELRAWSMSESSQQLAFPELVVNGMSSDAATLLAQLRAHVLAIRALLGWLPTTKDVDDARAALLRDVQGRHVGERVVVFSEYADTIDALYRRLAHLGGVAALTHGGVRVPAGRMTRRELLAQFGERPRVAGHERVDLLLTTDLLSEGVDLRAASVVVHLDLAWNPARLEQRVGRLRRLGSPHDHVHVYYLPPPAAAERMLQLERRLRVKLAVATNTLGGSVPLLRDLAPAPPSDDARRRERIATLLERWPRDGRSAERSVAAARADFDAAIACVERGGERTLVIVRAGHVDDDAAAVESVLHHANGEDVPPDLHLASRVERDVLDWLRRRDITRVVSLPEIRLARSRRAVLRRVDTIVKRTPRHAQAGLAPLMHAARSAAAATLSAGAEQVLDHLATASLDDGAWLRAMREFASVHARADTTRRVLALLLLVRDR
jgi:superfamily II DNA or RNA helicase